MKEKEQIICDVTTGICGPADEKLSGVMPFVDLSKEREKDQEAANKDATKE